jgi:hypothetical protein
MGLNEENGLFDDRQPVTISAINVENLPTSVDRLRRNGVNIESDGRSRVGPSVEEQVAIELTYNQPDVSVSTSARFVEHETIGGPVVRQKIGEGEVEVDIEGVCTTAEAVIIDNFRFESTVDISSERYSGRCQVASINTNPFSEGGAINLEGDFTHNFGISLVEVQ